MLHGYVRRSRGGSSALRSTTQMPHGHSAIHTHQLPRTHASDEPVAPQSSSELPSQLNSARSNSFRCQVCGRADHLNRHLRNHENLRRHKCTQCPKRFNRADLLRRHRLSHDRPSISRPNGNFQRPRRSQRDCVEAACLACIASKSKCQDEKPCIRCQRRQIECEPSPSTKTSQQPSGQPRTSWKAKKVILVYYNHLLYIRLTYLISNLRM
jgi:hypothetical protein